MLMQGNIFDRVPDDPGRELFDVLARGENLTIERIISSGQGSPAEGWYDQAFSEWVIVLKGDARIQFEDGTVVDLAEGDYINIPAHQRHRVLSTSAVPKTVWLAVHYR